MGNERLVIIGGVAAGMSAASAARRIDARMEIVVLERGTAVSYGACGLPYFVAGRLERAEDLVVHTAEFFRNERGIDVRPEHEVTQIEPARKLVHALANGSQPVTIGYDRLVLATGGEPTIEISGSNRPNVFTLNDLAHGVRLRDFLDRERPLHAVIVGSSYIGLEATDAFAGRGIEVTMLERSTEVLAGIEPEIRDRVEAVLHAHGVALHKHSEACVISGAPGGPATAVEYGNGTRGGTGIATDFVLLATGLRPRTGLATNAGVGLGQSGAIGVDERMRTNESGIYAAGDCAETVQLVSGRPTYFPLGTTANKQGRVAGENAAGGDAKFAGIVGTLMTQVFELGIARTGLSVAQAREAGFAPAQITITGATRAQYFGGKPHVVTLIWDSSDGRLLGCQMAGEDGAAKRIDAAAVALHARMRLPDMLHLDLAYAPPFATVWDPLLIAVHEAHKKWKHGG
jgi:NADPH-dependent 2,4-dienoyl-CoA reductase/sulfur reductase-like enzyme